VRTATATADPTNVLRFDVRVTTTELAIVAVEVWEVGQPRSTSFISPYTTTNARTGTAEVWGLKPSTQYNYRVLVDPAVGANYTDAVARRFTTAAMPVGYPRVTTTTYTGSPDFDYFLFDGDTNAGDGVLVIADTAGAIRWYQRLSRLGINASFQDAWYDADDDAVYGVVNLDEFVRYELDGTVAFRWTTADVLQDYIHHEARFYDGVYYFMTARSFTQGRRSYIEEGIEGYDVDGNLVYEWWARDAGMNIIDDEPYAWNTGVTFFASTFPGAYDWTHFDSLQVREEDGVLKAYLSSRNLWQVIKVDMPSGSIDWRMGRNDSGSANSEGDFTMDPSGISTTWWSGQHHAHWEDDGKFYLFDNSLATGISRGLQVDIDESAMTVSIEREVDFDELHSGAFQGSCDRESGLFHTPADHIALTCGPSSIMADFDAADTLTWSATIATSLGIFRAQPLDTIGH
jgi:hypothetical protein